jgi:hypothetical protein
MLFWVELVFIKIKAVESNFIIQSFCLLLTNSRTCGPIGILKEQQVAEIDIVHRVNHFERSNLS